MSLTSEKTIWVFLRKGFSVTIVPNRPEENQFQIDVVKRVGKEKMFRYGAYGPLEDSIWLEHMLIEIYKRAEQENALDATPL